MRQQANSDWQIEYLRLLKQLLDVRREEARRFWERTRWLRWLTLPTLPGWEGVWWLIYYSEEAWQAMWTVATAPEQATRRQRFLAYFCMPRLRRLAAMHLWWLQHGNYLQWVVWINTAGAMFIYTLLGIVIYRRFLP